MKGHIKQTKIIVSREKATKCAFTVVFLESREGTRRIYTGMKLRKRMTVIVKEYE